MTTNIKNNDSMLSECFQNLKHVKESYIGRLH